METEAARDRSVDAFVLFVVDLEDDLTGAAQPARARQAESANAPNANDRVHARSAVCV